MAEIWPQCVWLAMTHVTLLTILICFCDHVFRSSCAPLSIKLYLQDMEQVWAHYARPPDYKLIDKSGLKAMAEDAVNSFLDAAKKWIQQENPRWSNEKVDTKLNFLRGQFLPGLKQEDSVVIATHFLAHELKFQSSEEAKASGVTKVRHNLFKNGRALFSSRFGSFVLRLTIEFVSPLCRSLVSSCTSSAPIARSSRSSQAHRLPWSVSSWSRSSTSRVWIARTRA